ncbi:hypothetical protein [Leuconostoc fallax]|uniref:hypothetical protein n=1 Tax=Leuconostoc fallax TaxID=1251 RepID=UPI0002DCE39A|nr:hypothetical protein [Leuconostoc fallax]MBU7455349.1 hypothetical protein [Leuconostoc fallax]
MNKLKHLVIVVIVAVTFSLPFADVSVATKHNKTIDQDRVVQLFDPHRGSNLLNVRLT